MWIVKMEVGIHETTKNDGKQVSQRTREECPCHAFQTWVVIGKWHYNHERCHGDNEELRNRLNRSSLPEILRCAS